jgi:hypothetical protein
MKSGLVQPGGFAQKLPSITRQPKLPPDVRMSISSHAFWPTSPAHSWPVRRSKVHRHGLRRPKAQTSGAPSTPSANGLSAGMV